MADKTDRKTTITMDSNTEKLMKEMVKLHNANSISSYVRGLTQLDVLLTHGKTNVAGVPIWLLTSYPLDFLREARQLLQKSYRWNLLSWAHEGRIDLDGKGEKTIVENSLANKPGKK